MNWLNRKDLNNFSDNNRSSVRSSMPSDLSMTPELKNQLLSGLEELRSLSGSDGFLGLNGLGSDRQFKIFEDGFTNLRNERIDKYWDMLRGLKGDLLSQVGDEKAIGLGDKLKFNNILNKILEFKSPNEIVVEHSDIQILVEKFNPIFGLYKEKLSSLNTTMGLDTHSEIFQINDGKLIVDLSQANEILGKTIDLLSDVNTIGTSIGLAIGGGLLYKAVVTTYSKNLTSILDKPLLLNLSEAAKAKIVSKTLNENIKFHKSYGVLGTICLFVMFQHFKAKLPIDIKINQSSNNLEELSTNSLFSFFFRNKLPKWLKYLLFAIILSIINDYIFPYLSIVLVKLIGIIYVILNILYNLYSVYVLINLNDTDIIPVKYFPTKFKNHINELKEVKNSSEGKVYIQLYLTSGLFMLLLLLIFIIITSLLEIF